MASLLRSGKFVRFFSGLARNFALNPHRPDAENVLTQHRSEWEPKLHRCVASASFPQTLNHSATPQENAKNTKDGEPQGSQALDKALYKVDLDIKRVGRISKREIEEIFAEIKLNKTASSTQSLLVIRCCGNLVPEEAPEVRTQLVQDIWNTLESLGVPMDISHYNALLRVYLENEHQFSPSEFLAYLERKGVEPNRVTYQRLISHYCQQGDIEGASQILQLMKDREMPINENVFNALVMGHAQANDMESAQSILAVMKQAGLEPGSDTYTALACGYAKQGDMANIERILAECQKNDVHLLDKDLLEILYSLAVSGQGEHVEQILEKTSKTAGYNQEAMNTIFRLVNKGQEDAAYKVLLTMKPSVNIDGQSSPAGSFFIRQLVKANRPQEKVIHFCEDLKVKRLNERSLYKALESALLLQKPDLAIGLMSTLKAQSEPLRPHYFWPLLVQVSKTQGETGILQVLQQMTDLEVIPNAETMRDYVLPHLPSASSNPTGVLRKLRSANVPLTVVVQALVQLLLQRGTLDSATQLILQYNVRVDGNYVRKMAAEAYLRHKDAPAFAEFTRAILEKSQEENSDVVGPFVLEIFNEASRPKAAALQPLLEAFVEQGLGMSNSVAQVIQDKLGEELNEKLSELLGKLSSGELTPVPLERRASFNERNETPLARKKNLFVQYAREHKLEPLLAIKEELEKENFIFPVGMQAVLLDVYAFHNKTEEAWQIYTTLKANEPGLTFDALKTLRLAACLVKDARIDDAIGLLVANVDDRKASDLNQSVARNAASFKILNCPAEQGNVEVTKTLLKALKDSKLVEISNAILGPLIKCHLVKDDMDGALLAFEECCKEHKCTPWKGELMGRLIQAEDTERLQKVMDLSMLVHGEMNALYDLVFSFLDCGRVRQAKKVLETPGLRAKHARLESACQRYLSEGRIAELENLVQITKDLFDVDRHLLHFYLLQAYSKAGNPDKALGVWTMLQEEDIQPSEEFLRTLAQCLQQHQKPVPFAIPTADSTPVKPAQASNAAPVRTSSATQRRAPRVEVPVAAATPVDDQQLNVLRQYRRAVSSKDASAALATLQELKDMGKLLNVTDTSNLLELLVQNQQFAEATELCLHMLERQVYPLPQIFRFYVSRLAKTGDVEALAKLESHLTSETKKLVSYDNHLCAAAAEAGQGQHYLDKMLEEIENSKPEDVEHLKTKFPRGGAFALLEKDADLLPKFSTLAEKYLAKGITAPYNVLWALHMGEGRLDEASKIWPHLQHSRSVQFQNVCRSIRRKIDASLGQNLVETLRTASAILPSALGVAYSAWLDVLVMNNNFSEALEVIKQAVGNKVLLDDLNRTALIRVKRGLEDGGLSFPYTIPNKKPKGKNASSSDSSSDDEKQ